MKKLTILSCSIDEIKLKEQLESIECHLSDNRINVIYFNNTNKKMNIFSTNNLINLKIIDVGKNLGKTFNILNYIEKNSSEFDYFMVLDDKLKFINNIDNIINFINSSNSDLYTLKLKYDNSPYDLEESFYFQNNFSMNDYYSQKIPNIQSSDRVWIFKGDSIKNNKKLKSTLKLNFLQNEISISGLMINYWYYNFKCLKIYPDDEETFIYCRYSNKGQSHNKDWWIDNEPNSRIWERLHFAFLKKNVFDKMKFFISFVDLIFFAKKRSKKFILDSYFFKYVLIFINFWLIYKILILFINFFNKIFKK